MLPISWWSTYVAYLTTSREFLRWICWGNSCFHNDSWIGYCQLSQTMITGYKKEKLGHHLKSSLVMFPVLAGKQSFGWKSSSCISGCFVHYHLICLWSCSQIQSANTCQVLWSASCHCWCSWIHFLGEYWNPEWSCCWKGTDVWYTCCLLYGMDWGSQFDLRYIEGSVLNIILCTLNGFWNHLECLPVLIDFGPWRP